MDTETKAVDPKETTAAVPVNGTDGMSDAAALAKAALAAVAKSNEKAAETTPEPKGKVVITDVAEEAPKAAAAPEPEKKAEEAAPKAKKAKPTKEEKAVAKAKAKEEKAAAKAAKKAEKDAKKAASEEKKASKSDRKSWGDKSVGQCGAKIDDLTLDKLNEHEKATLLALGTEGHRKSLTLKDMASAAFPNMKKTKAGYTVRNALRRLVRGRLVEKEARGTYIQTEDGRKQAKKG